MNTVSLSVVWPHSSCTTAAIVAVGLYSARYARRSDEDYFLAGRSLGRWVAALSASASSESGWVTLGLVGIGFAGGVQGYWVIPGCLLGYLFNWFVIAGRMNEQARQLGAVTLPDFLAFRFNERVPLIRTVAVLVILAAMMAYVAAQMAAAGKTFSVLFEAAQPTTPTVLPGDAVPASAAEPPQVTEDPATAGVSWQYSLGVVLGAIIVLLYTVTGGFRAVCWTDALQALLMLGALVVFPVYLLARHGGYAFITQTLGDVADPVAGLPAGYLLDPWAGLAGLALVGFLLGSHALGINFGYPGMPHVLVRFMALKDRREARVAGVVAFCWGLCVYWGAVTVGLFVRAMYESGADWAAILQVDKEVGLVAAAIYLLPGVLSGLVVAAVLAAICSTADSQLVVAAGGPRSVRASLQRPRPDRTHARQPAGRTRPGHRGCTASVRNPHQRLPIRADLRLGDAGRGVRPPSDPRRPLAARLIRRLPGRHVGRLHTRADVGTALRQRGHRHRNLQPAAGILPRHARQRAR
jgi:Na+/proline symporter